jgi:hypothetical protein
MQALSAAVGDVVHMQEGGKILGNVKLQLSSRHMAHRAANFSFRLLLPRWLFFRQLQQHMCGPVTADAAEYSCSSSSSRTCLKAPSHHDTTGLSLCLLACLLLACCCELHCV